MEIPKKLEDFDKSKARYKGLKGGRGSGKSYYFADKLLEVFLDNPDTHWVCMREIQKSIDKSSKKLIEDRIDYYNLHDYFEILQTVIRAKRGKGEIIFQGLQDHTADSIKSLEGFHGVWVEEAMTITEKSLDLLTPTFRRDDSELWFSWNPFLKSDPVEKLFREKDNSLLVHINFTENPFAPKVLISEAEEMRVKDPDKFMHIFLGYPQTQSETALFTYKLVEQAMNRNAEASGATVVSADIARFGNDKSCIVVRSGLWVKQIITKSGSDLTETADWIKAISNVYKADAIVVDSIGIGAGVLDILLRSGYFAIDGNFSKKATDEVRYHNKRASSYFDLKKAMDRGLAIPNDDELAEELLAIEYEFTSAGRVKIVDKDKIKKTIGRSPDKADAMALSYFTDIHSNLTEAEKNGYDYITPSNVF